MSVTALAAWSSVKSSTPKERLHRLHNTVEINALHSSKQERWEAPAAAVEEEFLPLIEAATQHSVNFNDDARNSIPLEKAMDRITELENRLKEIELNAPKKYPDVVFLNYKNKKRIMVSLASPPCYYHNTAVMESIFNMHIFYHVFVYGIKKYFQLQ